MSNLNLKGLWIPIEILTDKNLSDKENNYCYCTDSNISELLNISITQFSKLVNSLKKKRYIDIEIKYKDNSKEIESRKLIPKMDTPYLTKVKYPPQQNFNTPIEEKFKDNKYNNDKQNFKKTKANFEERAYEGFNFDTLYANYSIMKGTS